jgi:hypothetical protein
MCKKKRNPHTYHKISHKTHKIQISSKQWQIRMSINDPHTVTAELLTSKRTCISAKNYIVKVVYLVHALSHPAILQYDTNTILIIIIKLVKKMF